MQEDSSFQEIALDPTMFDLFRLEIETQCKILNQGLVEIERNPKDQKLLESLMRAAHSIKGAARVINLNPIVRLAHIMEDCFTDAQKEPSGMPLEKIDLLFRHIDFLEHLSKINIKEINLWLNEKISLLETLIAELATPLKLSPMKGKEETLNLATQLENQLKEDDQTTEMKNVQSSIDQDKVLRITAENLNRLIGLAGESLVESRWLYPFGKNLQKFKSQFIAIEDGFSLLKNHLEKQDLNEMAQHALSELDDRLQSLHVVLNERLGELDDFIRRHANLSDRFYQEVINSRMRPLADGVEAFPRMVRDLAHQLGKQVKLLIEGQTTLVDREMLEKLESPLNHLLRNAIDHGIEFPEERVAAGKSAEGLIKLEAHHRAGMLSITVSDDGKGIDIEQLKSKIVEKHLVNAEMASRLTDSEVIDFLFLPGFSTSPHLTEISGRGIGLNIVQSMIQKVGGKIYVQSVPSKGITFQLQLPVTLSVIRALIAEISGELYAFPLARIDQAFLVSSESMRNIEGDQYFQYEGRNIGCVVAWNVLELSEPRMKLESLSVIVLSDQLNRYGLIVDRFVGEKELVVQALDSRLGKVPNMNASALMEEGSPVLIVDIDDMLRSIHYLLSGGREMKLAYSKEEQSFPSKKRILIVDDSMTVREMESRLLLHQGYQVETAVNGVDGWNAVRIGNYDLVITDIDMPRMNGMELLREIKNDPRLCHLPVMIVSYKGEEKDRIKGLEAGADYYLTKNSFHDTTLINAVKDLIGNP